MRFFFKVLILTVSNIHAQFRMSDILTMSTFVVPLRKQAQQINNVIMSQISSPPYIRHAIDRQGTEILTIKQSETAFKRETNLPEMVDIKQGVRVMFLDNSLIMKGISNGSTGVVVGHSHNGNPNVAFPVVGGIEVYFVIK